MHASNNFLMPSPGADPRPRTETHSDMLPLTLHRVTFTGADDSTDPKALARLALAHPWIEFAVLVSPSQQGSGRYPSRAWRERFYASDTPVAQRALHLCGRAVDQFAAGNEMLCRELDQAQRVQLNFVLGRIEPATLRALPGEILGWQAYAPAIEFILQANKSNAQLTSHFSPTERYSNLSFLVDSSGGRGIAPQSWPTPIAGFPTAYAGGIGPGRIHTTLEALSRVTRQTAIDMESSLRSDDLFDLDKVEQVVAELLTHCDFIEGSAGRPVLSFCASARLSAP